MPIKYVCEYCGSENITFTANARFNKDTQEFVIADIMDEAFCNDCEKEIDCKQVNSNMDENEQKAYDIYQEKGKVGVEDAVKNGELKVDDWKYCPECKSTEPVYNKACLVCGTVLV